MHVTDESQMPVTLAGGPHAGLTVTAAAGQDVVTFALASDPELEAVYERAQSGRFEWSRNRPIGR